jgi:hypothetical protein
MSEPLLWFLAVLSSLIGAAVLRLGVSTRELHRTLDRFAGDLARTTARLESLQKQLNSYWQSVEMRIGSIQALFEAGRACRMGTTMVGMDVQMGHLNRKVEELMARLPRPEQAEEGK